MHLVQKEPDTKLVYSTVVGESIPFVIGDSSVVIDIIRKKIYSYPLRTMVQEYLSNARDSQMEAGNDPSEIEVFLPSSINPEFSVRDYGVGMSDERVREVFVQYGISTKRKSNSQLGYFGIGSKSGWAYTDSFIVESFYNGMHRQYIADIGDNKEGRLLLHTEKPTDERNGVLIKIPVNANDIYQFVNAYIRTTCFWEKKPKLTFAHNIEYPKLVYDLGDISIHKINIYDLSDIRIYKINRTSTFGSGIVFNAAGIPFDNTSSLETLNLAHIRSFCSTENVMIAIDVDPAILGISANRETYSNKKYAEKKIKSAIDKISEHVKDSFESSEAKDYIEIFNKLGILSTFAHSSFFIKKEYNIRKGYSSCIDICINKGHFSLICHGIKYHKSVKKIISVTNAKEIFLSRSKIVLIKNMNGSFMAPVFESPTKKAFSIAKRTDLFSNERDASYVFFQEDLTDAEYMEIAAVVGATRYLEDAFKDVKPPKLPKTETNKEPDKIYVYPFEIPSRCSDNATRRKESRILDEAFINNNKAIFYGRECSRELIYFLNKLSRYNLCAVYGSPSTLEKIRILNNPKLIPIENFAEYIKSTPDILGGIINQHVVTNRKSVWRMLDGGITQLSSKKYDLKNLNKTAMYYIKNYCDSINPNRIISDIELKSELTDFLETYPLLNVLSEYDLHPRLYQHINFYIKSIDEGLIQ